MVAVLRRVLISSLGRISRRRRRGLAGGGRILVLAFEDQLGSAMTVTPLFPALRHRHPEAEIVVAGPPLVTELLRPCPDVDRLVTLPRPQAAPLRSVWAFWRGLGREGAFDRVVVTPAGRRLTVGLMALTAPAAVLAGHGAPDVLPWFDEPAAFDSRAAMIANAMAVLGPPAEPPPVPRIHFAAADLEAVRRQLAAAGIDPDSSLAVIAAATSGGQPTDWLPERMAEVADVLARRYGLRIVFVGDGAGAAKVEAVRGRMAEASLSLAGRTSVPQLGALMAMADLVVALDSGAMHVAHGAGAPMVVVAGAWQDPAIWRPRPDRLRAVAARDDIACARCGLSRCATMDCLTAIGAGDVLALVAGLLEREPPSPAARAERIAQGLSDGAPSGEPAPT